MNIVSEALIELVVIITVSIDGGHFTQVPLIYETTYESTVQCELARDNPSLELKTWLYKEVTFYRELGLRIIPQLTGSICVKKS